MAAVKSLIVISEMHRKVGLLVLLSFLAMC